MLFLLGEVWECKVRQIFGIVSQRVETGEKAVEREAPCQGIAPQSLRNTGELIQTATTSWVDLCCQYPGLLSIDHQILELWKKLCHTVGYSLSQEVKP